MKRTWWKYHHFTYVYQKPQSYELQFLRNEVRKNFCHFGPLLPPPPTTDTNKIFKKMKKAYGDVIILNLCNKKHDHMMYLTQIWSATDIIFALLPHYWKILKKIFKKNVKNAWRYHPFTHMYHKSRSYDVWLLQYKVYLCHFLPFDPPNNPQNQNFEKNKNTLRYYHFTFVYHK